MAGSGPAAAGCRRTRWRQDLRFQGMRVERSGQEKALGLVHVRAAQQVHLVGRFDAFGQRRKSRSLPSWTSVLMRAFDSGEVVMALVNMRSILRQSTGNRRR